MVVENLRMKNPLVLHYTNEVTINDCANVTLAIGASPLMSYSLEEAEEIIKIASAIVINIGTMNSLNLKLFIKAGILANKYNKPVILDPVGCFATKTRLEFTKKLIGEINFSVIKGNLSEIKAIGGLTTRGKGVDSEEEAINKEEIKALALSLKTTIALTGREDFITDGMQSITLKNGTAYLKGVTGTGCMTASLIASFLGSGLDPFNSSKYGVLTMGIAGELSAINFKGYGSFKVDLIDNISNITTQTIEKHIEETRDAI